MFKIWIRNHAGEKRTVFPNENYDSTWEPTGEIDQDGVAISELSRQADQKIQSWAAAFGVSSADFLKAAAVALGIPPCSFCQLRDKVLHRIDELGKVKAFWMLAKSVAIQAQFWKGREKKQEELEALEKMLPEN